MRPAFTIAALELRRRVRDRSALIYGFIAPLLLAGIITLAFGAGEGSFEVRVWAVDADRSPASQAILGGLRDALDGSTVALIDAPSADAARREVEDEERGAALVIPEGFGASLAGERPLSLSVIRTEADPVAGGVATGVAQGIASRIDAGRLAVATALQAGGELPSGGVAQLVASAQQVRPPITVADDFGTGGDEIDLAAYFGPSMAIVFLFFSVGAGARSVLAEKQEGTLARVRAAPITDRDLLLGKTVAVYVVATASILTMWAATSLLFGADWGDPAAVVVLCLVTVLAVAGIAALVTSLASTAGQAEMLTAGVAMTLALVGGNFLTPGVTPPVLENVSRLTPNGWSLQAFTELAVDHAGLGSIGDALIVLVAMAAASGVVAVVRLNRLATT